MITDFLVTDFLVTDKPDVIELHWSGHPNGPIGLVAFIRSSKGVVIELVNKTDVKFFRHPLAFQSACETRYAARDFRPFVMRAYQGGRLTCDEWLEQRQAIQTATIETGPEAA